MKKRFILLIDFSEYSKNLIRYATDWCKQVNAELVLVHQTVVITPALTDSESKQQIAHYTNSQALHKLKTFVQEFIPASVRVTYEVTDDNLQLLLNRLLAEPYEHLVFVGLKGAGLLKKIFLGTTSLQVIDSTENSIVAMPKEIDSFSHEKIFVAVSERYPLNVLELNNFLSFIDSKNTQITFFYLAKPHEATHRVEKMLRDLSKLFGDRFLTDSVIYEGNNRFQDIKKVINDKVDEILIVQKGSRMLTDQLFRKFLINELVYQGQTPLVILP